MAGRYQVGLAKGVNSTLTELNPNLDPYRGYPNLWVWRGSGLDNYQRNSRKDCGVPKPGAAEVTRKELNFNLSRTNELIEELREKIRNTTNVPGAMNKELRDLMFLRYSLMDRISKLDHIKAEKQKRALLEKYGHPNGIPTGILKRYIVQDLVIKGATKSEICNLLDVTTIAHYLREVGVYVANSQSRTLEKFGYEELSQIVPLPIATVECYHRRNKAIARLRHINKMSFRDIGKAVTISSARAAQIVSKIERQNEWDKRNNVVRRSPLELYLAQDKSDTIKLSKGISRMEEAMRKAADHRLMQMG